MTVATPPGQEEPQPRHGRAGAILALFGTGAGGAGAFGLLQTQAMPGWGLVLVLLAALAVFGLHTVLPQRSRDRLEWWRRHRERLRDLRPAPRARRRGRRARP